MVSLRRAPSMATLLSVIADSTKATNTPRMVKVCDRRRPMTLPPKVVPRTPASSAPASGASGTASRVDVFRVVLMFLCAPFCSCGLAGGLAFELVQVLDADVRLVAEQEHQ